MYPSKALLEFKENLRRARALISLESKLYKDPPPAEDQAAVEALRSSAAILMVAAFEVYINDRFSEFISHLAKSSNRFTFSSLPNRMKVANSFNSLERALRGPRFGQPAKKINRLQDVKRVSGYIAKDQLIQDGFGLLSRNPNRENIKTIFLEIDISKIYSVIKPRFENRWKNPLANTFIADKLDEIISRRNKAAHGEAGLEISRGDLREALKFLRILSEVLDIELRAHRKKLIREASSP